MIVKIDQIADILQCPASGKPLFLSDCASKYNTNDGTAYPVIGNTPILIDFSKSILSRETVFESSATSPIQRSSYKGLKKIAKKFVSREFKQTIENVSKIMKDLEIRGCSRVLIVGGGAIGQGMAKLYESETLEIIGFDIYSNELVQFVADGHNIPLIDDSVDAVVVQAVLEHVLEPRRVVTEIYRVLKINGLVYSETPFMQQVHEGAYDFTRFTDSGHQLLFGRFQKIEAGVVGGPAVALQWSIDYFCRSLFRSRTAGKLSKLLFFWLPLVDRFIDKSYAIDAASGCFYLGRKTTADVNTDAVAIYQGSNI